MNKILNDLPCTNLVERICEFENIPTNFRFSIIFGLNQNLFTVHT